MAVTSPFSVRLAPKLKERLQAEAKRADRPQAVEAYLAAADEKRAAIRAAVKHADAGHLIPGGLRRHFTKPPKSSRGVF